MIKDGQPTHLNHKAVTEGSFECAESSLAEALVACSCPSGANLSLCVCGVLVRKRVCARGKYEKKLW